MPEPQVISLDGNDWKLLMTVPREWENQKVWRDDWTPEKSSPALGNFIPGTVPGDVISDALDAGLIPHPYVDVNSRQCEWLSERDWAYMKDFAAPQMGPGDVLRLCFEGVDFECHVYLNGELLGTHVGMIAPFEFDITKKVRTDKPNHLVIAVMHAPSVDLVQGQIGRTSQARVWKSRFAYGWDWCTRLIPVGIYRSVTLVNSGPAYLTETWYRPRVNGSGNSVVAEVEARVRAAGAAGASALVELMEGERVIASGRINLAGSAALEGTTTLRVNNPKLWWPLHEGEQHLYTARVTLSANGGVSDARSERIGLRNIRMVRNEDSSPDALPYTFEVNGRTVYARGWNWVPMDHMYGRDHGDTPPAQHPIKNRYERSLQLAAHAHCNLLRVWGGGLLEARKFYDLCDELGILVWQEFPLSSSGIDNHPPDDAEYLAYIETRAREMVPLRRNHACFAVWCGGNELLTPEHKPLTDEHPALAKLKSVVTELDPDRAWVPCSPSGPEWSTSIEKAGTGRMHEVHGPWKYAGPQKHYELYNLVDPLVHSEFGVEGAANLETIEKFFSEGHRWPPDRTNPVWLHHGSWWIQREMIDEVFGPTDNLQQYVLLSQWLQAEGLRYCLEAHRRRSPHCSGAFPWQFNEAFPNACCTNAVDYLLRTKPVYWWVRQAGAPDSITLKYDRLTWKPGEQWQAELWAITSRDLAESLHWRFELFDFGGAPLQQKEGEALLSRDRAVMSKRLQQILPEQPGIYTAFLTLAESSGRVVARNEYLFTSMTPAFEALKKAPEVSLRLRTTNGALVLENECDCPALMLRVHADDELSVEQGYFCLPPKGSRAIGPAGLKCKITGLNAMELTA